MVLTSPTKIHLTVLSSYFLKGYFSMKPAKKILSLPWRENRFELALQPSTALTANIQIKFSRQGD